MHIAIYPLLAVILFASNAILPQFGIVASVFSPLVLLLYFSHPKRAPQYDMLLFVLIIALAVLNYTLAGFFLISPLFTAFFIRYTYRNNLQTNWLPAAGAAALSFVAAFIFIYGLPAYRSGLVEFTSKALQTFMDSAREVNAPMVQSPYFTQIEENRTQTALALVLMFPGFNYMYSVFAAYVSLRLFNKIKSVPTELFRLPDFLVWALILSFALIFAPFMFARFAGVNFALVFLTLYAFQGFDIILFWMNRMRVIPILKAIIFIFIFSEPPIILVISLIGLFSVWFNFYGKKPEEEQESSE